MNDISNLKFLGDIIVVEHLEKNIQSSTLIIPETTRDWVAPVKARVLAIGKLVKPRKDYLRDRKKRGCANKTFACDYISIGDTVLVPVELGTRGRVSGNDDAIIYDSEDIIALVEDTSKVTLHDGKEAYIDYAYGSDPVLTQALKNSIE